jgi:8-oxo-dGTP pyrophosphatase MutT (NUDIX family)
MTQQDPHPEIIELDRIEIAVEPWSWKFALTQRDEIARYFAALQRERTGVWNGRVLLLHRYAIADRVMRGACFETDYASFIAWRDGGFPDPSVYNFFAAAAVRSADGAFLVGDMASYTAGAGQVCFPGGTPDRDDILPGGVLDIGGNLKRELLEETGLDIAELDAKPGWTMVHDRGFVALMKRIAARCGADELRARVMAHLAKEAQPEFVDMRMLRGPADLDDRMRRFHRVYLEQEWRR